MDPYKAQANNRGKLFLLHGIYWLILAAIVVAEIFYREGLINISRRMMKYIQDNETEAGRFFFKWISIIGLGLPYFIGAFCMLIFNSLRGRSFYHLLFLCVSFFVVSVTLMAYAEPRMFWWVYYIIPDECTTEYGNPSGHTELAIAYPLMLWLDIFENRRNQEKVEGKMSWGQIISLVSVFLWSFIVGFARLYVRVHSWNQIIYGWQLGLWLAFYFHFCWRDSIIAHIDSITSQPKLLSNKRIQYIITASLLFILELAILFSTYFISKELKPPNPEWTEEIERKCPNKVFGESKFYADESIVLSSLSIVPYTAYLAIILHRQKVGRVWPDMLVNTGFCSTLGRLLIQILLPLPFVTPLFLGSHLPVWMQLAFTSFVPMMAVGFFMYFGPMYLWKRFELVNLDSRPMHLLMTDDDDNLDTVGIQKV